MSESMSMNSCEDHVLGCEDHVLVRTKGLTKVYGKKKVVDAVDLEIKRGSIYGFIGKNGSGKTTTMRLILGLCKPSSGSVEFCDEYKGRGRSNLSAVIEYPAFYPNMNAMTNMITQCLALGVKKPKNVSSDLLTLMGLNPKDSTKVKNFSLGMKQRLAIAMSLICRQDSPASSELVSKEGGVEGSVEGKGEENSEKSFVPESSVGSVSAGNSSLPDLSYPSLLFLDEPINGLDPEGIREIREIILRLNKEKGVTFLISSHILSELEKIATDFGVICNGKLSAQFDAKDLRKKVQGCIRLKTNDNNRAAEILQNELAVSNYRFEDGEILIFDSLSVSDVTKKLVENDLIIESISSENGNYEDYFIKLMGGN